MRPVIYVFLRIEKYLSQMQTTLINVLISETLTPESRLQSLTNISLSCFRWYRALNALKAMHTMQKLTFPETVPGQCLSYKCTWSTSLPANHGHHIEQKFQITTMCQRSLLPHEEWSLKRQSPSQKTLNRWRLLFTFSLQKRCFF